MAWPGIGGLAEFRGALSGDHHVKKLNLWFGALFQRVHRLRETLRKARMLKLRQKVLAQGEAERLDRIRRPWKYLGK